MYLPVDAYCVSSWSAIVLFRASDVSFPTNVAWLRTLWITCHTFFRTCRMTPALLGLCGRSSSFVLPMFLFRSLLIVSVFLFGAFLTLSSRCNITHQYSNRHALFTTKGSKKKTNGGKTFSIVFRIGSCFVSVFPPAVYRQILANGALHFHSI